MENPLRWIALVLLEEAELPEFDEVARFVGENFSDPPTMTVAGSTENLFTCTIGEYTAAVTLVPTQVPWSQLEGPCAMAWYWPDAAEEVRDHTAHLMVTLIDEGSKSVEKSETLTQLVSGLVGCAKAQGVFWGPGRLIHPPRPFIEQAVQSTAADLPLFLWIDFRMERTEAGTMRLYTTGLAALEGTELEVDDFAGDAQHLLEFCYNIAHYQLCQGKLIKDGDTIGLTDEVQVIAHRRKSMFDEEMEVIQLEFQNPGM